MTFEQMNKWTQRFNQIKGASQKLKNKRLGNMLNDLVLAHGPNDFHARQMYLAVMDEMEV
ncbi:hypothetical protein [Oceanobacillus sp. FSL W7-1309]|uniref:hypothetical protein n=1 Tax=Oceanobacillus sp. FSL W7-1309 TaxID=2954539 RepID=UPI0030F860A4